MLIEKARGKLHLLRLPGRFGGRSQRVSREGSPLGSRYSSATRSEAYARQRWVGFSQPKTSSESGSAVVIPMIRKAVIDRVETLMPIYEPWLQASL